MNATNRRSIDEMKAMNYGSNGEEIQNTQVTIRWTGKTHTHNHSNDEQFSMFKEKSTFT